MSTMQKIRLTKEDIDDIARRIATLAKKDTEFPETNTLGDEDLIAIVQDGVNKIISVDGFAEQLMAIMQDQGLIIDVAPQINEAIDALDGSASIVSIDGNIVTIKTGIVENNGVISNTPDEDISLSAVAVTGVAGDVSITDLDNYYSGNTVESALSEVGMKIALLMQERHIYYTEVGIVEPIS